MFPRVAAAIVVALVLGAGQAQAAEPSPAIRAQRVPADSESPTMSARRSAYLQQAHNLYAQWQDKMRKWSTQAARKGRTADDAARENLARAWSDMQADWRRLQVSSAADWDKARSAFEAASHRMKDVWHNVASKG